MHNAIINWAKETPMTKAYNEALRAIGTGQNNQNTHQIMLDALYVALAVVTHPDTKIVPCSGIYANCADIIREAIAAGEMK